MLKIGSIILSILCILNIVPAVLIVFYILFTPNIHPLLPMRFSEAEINAVSPAMLDTVNGMAVFANMHVFAFSLVALVAIWTGLKNRIMWVFWVLLVTMTASVLAGFGASYVDGSHYYGPSIFAAILMCVGFILCAMDLFRS